MIESSRTNKGTTASAFAQAAINAGLSCTRMSRVNTTTADLTPLVAIQLLRPNPRSRLRSTSTRLLGAGPLGPHVSCVSHDAARCCQRSRCACYRRSVLAPAVFEYWLVAWALKARTRYVYWVLRARLLSTCSVTFVPTVAISTKF